MCAQFVPFLIPLEDRAWKLEYSSVASGGAYTHGHGTLEARRKRTQNTHTLCLMYEKGQWGELNVFPMLQFVLYRSKHNPPLSTCRKEYFYPSFSYYGRFSVSSTLLYHPHFKYRCLKFSILIYLLILLLVLFLINKK